MPGEGLEEGQSIRIQGEGEPGAGGGPRGDLYVLVRIGQHRVFARKDDDLVLQMPVSFTQAALGATVEIPTLESPAQVDIKPGTQHGDILRVPGRGLPNLRSGRPGDLVVAVTIEIPKKLKDKQRKLLHEYAETEDNRFMPESTTFWSRIKEYLGA